jgi:hypothetical protein
VHHHLLIRVVSQKHETDKQAVLLAIRDAQRERERKRAILAIRIAEATDPIRQIVRMEPIQSSEPSQELNTPVFKENDKIKDSKRA